MKTLTGSAARFLVVGMISLSVWGVSPPPARGNPKPQFEVIKNSLVKIYAQVNPIDLSSPWQRIGTYSTGGSGVIIEGRRILTAAHVVADAVNLEVKREGMTRRHNAEISFISHTADLALLTVSDSSFFEGVIPLKLGETPRLQDSVDVYGFPVGGESVSVTSGVVSRIEMGGYSHSGRSLLRLQIDAAVNPGNSGGPVLSEGALVGIVNSILRRAENVGYAAPVPVIRHFLNDIADGRHDGFPRLGIIMESLENEALKKYLGLEPHETGALITGVSYGSSVWDVLEKGDVLLTIDGSTIAEDLTIPFEGYHRVFMGYAPMSKQVGDTIRFSILRDGERIETEAILKDESFRIPEKYHPEESNYFVFGGLVFQPLTEGLLDGEVGTYIDLDSAFYLGQTNLKTEDRRRIIMLTKVLAVPLNRGYHDWESEIVTEVNGEVPRDMAELVKIIEAAEGPWLTIEILGGDILVLDLEKARTENAAILKKHNVPSDRPPGLVPSNF